ncbi:MAG TPA: maleylpyruvate isomerase family mycothiol-dependent enzyme [Acidimicrobiales bacterium]
MERDDYLSRVRQDGEALAAAASLGLDAQCPTCPEWRVRDLVAHTGMVHLWVRTLVTTKAQERIPRRDLPSPPTDDALVRWFSDGVSALVEVLGSTGPDEPVWNWSATRPKVAGFWPRRMAHETAVHRWDAQCAHGATAPIDPEAAVDGIEEILDTILPSALVDRAAQSVASSMGGTLHAHATDVPGEWLISVEDEVRVEREHGKGDAAVRAPASDLFLFLAGRLSMSDVEVFGDQAVIANWLEISRFA